MEALEWIEDLIARMEYQKSEGQDFVLRWQEIELVIRALNVLSGCRRGLADATSP